MRALTIREPWASLIAQGAKRYETRGWRTSYRGPLAIHAAATYGERDASRLRAWARRVPGLVVCPRHVVAVVTLADCMLMTPELIDAQVKAELDAGVWHPGRWAWLLADVRPLRRPIAVVGRQGLWTLPDDVAQAVREAAAGSGWVHERVEVRRG